jgi:hypothetical protein
VNAGINYYIFARPNLYPALAFLLHKKPSTKTPLASHFPGVARDPAPAISRAGYSAQRKKAEG